MKSVWRVSSNGPDWMDVLTYMREVEKSHACTVYVAMQPDGPTNAHAWHVSVVAVLPVLDKRGQQVCVAMCGSFPCRDHKTVEALAFALVAKVDWTIGSENYVQGSLFN